jgi:hypothetical protein
MRGTFPPHLQGSGSSRKRELWLPHGSNAADEGQARFVVIDDSDRQYLEGKPVLTVMSGELGSKKKATNRSKPIWAIWATAAGSIAEREGEEGWGHVSPKSEVDKGKGQYGKNNYKLSSFPRRLLHFLSSGSLPRPRSPPIRIDYSMCRRLAVRSLNVARREVPAAEIRDTNAPSLKVCAHGQSPTLRSFDLEDIQPSSPPSRTLRVLLHR